MNRNFLIFLMIGTTLMILVMGGHQTQRHPSYTPWNIDILENNKIRVFGVTLGKTTIQDANQIFASFPETRLVEKDEKLKLLAIYHELQFGGLVADIELSYNLDNDELKKLKDVATTDAQSGHLRLPEDIEMTLLSTNISKLVYKPSVDYEIDTILQRFGTPKSEQTISGNVTRWIYSESGLDILINQNDLDIFTYSLIK
jgi:hypothetical protein